MEGIEGRRRGRQKREGERMDGLAHTRTVRMGTPRAPEAPRSVSGQRHGAPWHRVRAEPQAGGARTAYNLLRHTHERKMRMQPLSKV